MKKIIIFALTAIMIFAGCGHESETTGEVFENESIAAEENEETVFDEEVLNLSMRTTTQFNPLLNKDESVDSILRLVYMPLARIDNTNKPKAEIAENWYYTQEGTVLNIKIKDEIYWHDGNPITANDVVYSINTIVDSEEGTLYKKCAEKIVDVSVEDKRTLTIRFSEAYSGNIYSLCFPVISKKNYETDTNVKMPVGSGAYGLSDIVPAKELILCGYENSFTLKPNIDTISVKMTTDKDTDVYSFSQNIIDCVVSSESEMGKYDFDSYRKFSFTDNYYEFLGFNFAKDVFTKKEIREAVSLCIPVDDIIDTVYLSDAVKTSSPVMPNSYVYNRNIPDMEYDVEEAGRIIKTSGYIYDDKNNCYFRINSEGEREIFGFGILVNEENTERIRSAEKIAESLKSIGVDAYVEKADFQTYQERLFKGDFDVFLGGYEMSLAPYFGDFFHSEGSMNFISYKNEKMDELLNEVYKSVSEKEIIEKYGILQELVYEEKPYISILFKEKSLYANNKTTGTFTPLDYNYYRNIENVDFSN